jgi:sec-independent protein translocase protein TatA
MLPDLMQPALQAFMPNIGWPEIVILLVIVLLVFGPKNLPRLANSMGRAIREFKDGIRGLGQVMEEDNPPEPKPPPRRPSAKPEEEKDGGDAQAKNSDTSDNIPS